MAGLLLTWHSFEENAEAECTRLLQEAAQAAPDEPQVLLVQAQLLLVQQKEQEALQFLIRSHDLWKDLEGTPCGAVRQQSGVEADAVQRRRSGHRSTCRRPLPSCSTRQARPSGPSRYGARPPQRQRRPTDPCADLRGHDVGQQGRLRDLVPARPLLPQVWRGLQARRGRVFPRSPRGAPAPALPLRCPWLRHADHRQILEKVPEEERPEGAWEQVSEALAALGPVADGDTEMAD